MGDMGVKSSEKIIEFKFKGLVLVHPVKIELEWKTPEKLAFFVNFRPILQGFLVLAQLTVHGQAPNL